MKSPSKLLISLILVAGMLLSAASFAFAAESDVILSDDASDFVLLSEAVPDAILEIRYYSITRPTILWATALPGTRSR